MISAQLNSRLRVCATAARYLTVAFLMLTLSQDAALAQRLKGKVSEGKYTSPRGLFTVTVPKASNWAGVDFTIQEYSETGERNYDTVAFYVKDFGEVLLAGVRRIPQSVLDQMAQDDPQNVLRNLNEKALTDWRTDLAGKPDVEAEEFLDTPYGQAALRIYKLTQGSIMEKSAKGKAFEHFDVFVGVIVAKRSNEYVSAIAEDDSNALEKDKLKARLRGLFAGIAVPETVPFEKN